MFNPFGGATDFYPGLIIWCDPACYEADTAAGSPSSKLGPHDYRKSRDLRPCLVISVNYDNQTFQGARLSATTPDDPSQWVKIDSPPPITWKLNGAFIWVGRPPTIAMVFDNPRVMHRKFDPIQLRCGCVQWDPSSGYQRTKTRTTTRTPSLRATCKTTGSTEMHIDRVSRCRCICTGTLVPVGALSNSLPIRLTLESPP
ncbi:hypothetical protein B0H14DRAFT_2821835 [Mycena olivaceomarginata]|nr:hypothetical protein B0H14DRAFT_2875497 [Mycena olivaceomarginata]KAJ7824964.1 hypothetical protein B0H14DRAFT_2821835 [Mycena olivaceomarginata]